MGLEPNPFDSVAVYGSPRKDDPNMAPDIATRTLGAHTYYWTIAEFVEQELLPSCSPTPRTSASSTRW